MLHITGPMGFGITLINFSVTLHLVLNSALCDKARHMRCSIAKFLSEMIGLGILGCYESGALCCGQGCFLSFPSTII